MRRAVFRLRTRRAWLLGLVLPALLLRAFIPAGFMPAPGTGGLSIVLCPGEAVLPVGLDGLSHPLHAHGPGHHPDGAPGAPATTHHAVCLFAVAGAAALSPVLPALAVEIPAFVRVQELPASGVFSPSILRAQHPRGPPTSLNA